jgi:hypothetical protein
VTRVLIRQTVGGPNRRLDRDQSRQIQDTPCAPILRGSVRSAQAARARPGRWDRTNTVFVMKSIAFVLLALLVVPQLASAQDVDLLFDQALRLERVQGDYRGAISIYEQIAGDSRADRTEVARSLVRMGKAYESLGRSEAFSIYERVVRDFRDQAQEVAEARERMRGLTANAATASPSPPVAKELTDLVSYASISPDGRFFANIDWNVGNLAIQEVGKDEITYVTSEDYSSSAYRVPNQGRFSADNRYFAYSMTYDSTGTRILVYDTVEKTTRDVLVQGFAPFEFLEVYDWISDQSAVLVAASREGSTEDLAIVEIPSGILRHVHPSEHEFAWKACLLDDRTVLFEHYSSNGTTIRRLDLETGTEEDFLPDTSGQILGGCSVKKQEVAIKTNLYGDYQTWLYAVASGRPSAEPKLLPEVDPNDKIVGLSDNGDLFLSAQRSVSSTTLYPFSIADGTVSGRGETLPDIKEIIFSGRPMVVTQRKPAWTNDGAKLAYRIGHSTLWVRETGGRSRTVRLGSGSMSLHWSADGTGLLSARRSWDGSGFVTKKLDARSGAVVDSTLGIFGSPGFSEDEVLDVRRKDAETMCAYEYGRGTAEPRELSCYSDDRSERFFEWPNGRRSVPADLLVLPDTRQLVVPSFDGDDLMQTLVDVDTGTARVLLDGPEWTKLTEMLPDGTAMLALTKEGAFFRVPLDGSPLEPQFERFSEINFVQYFAVHPKDNLILIQSTPRTPAVPDRDPDPLRVIRNLWE